MYLFCKIDDDYFEEILTSRNFRGIQGQTGLESRAFRQLFARADGFFDGWTDLGK